MKKYLRLFRVPLVCVFLLLKFGSILCAQANINPGHDISWRFTDRDVSEARRVSFDDSSWQQVVYKFKWKSRGFSWLRSRVVIPDTLDDKPAVGQSVGLRWNAGGGGEVYVNGILQSRYDNDHPPSILLTKRAYPGQVVRLAIRVYMGQDDNTEGEADISDCEMFILDANQIAPVSFSFNPQKHLGKLPQPFAGVSQGGGMPDYNPETAAKLREFGVKWFRMDNVLTNAVKRKDDGTVYYDWEDLDRRVDFIKSIGAEPILCVSYMPIPLDAMPNNERHSRPKDWNAWEELCYQAAKRCFDRGVRVKYWEVWNESNAGWIVPIEGEDILDAYLNLYDASARGIKRADPNAWIGGPCNASGPWNSDKGGAFVRGEMFMRGLMKHCEQTGMPLDFITWHEYFQPFWVIKDEADTIRKYLKDYPTVQKQVKEFMLTEWNFAWWGDRGHDNEVGAAWCANSVLRALIPGGINKTCLFLAKDGDESFRGSWGAFMSGNKPKAVANAMKMFCMLAPERIELKSDRDDIAGIASTDPTTGRTTVLLCNFGERYGMGKDVNVTLIDLPESLKNGSAKRYLIDKDHSNIWANRDRAELECAETLPIKDGMFRSSFRLENNAITLIELSSKK